MVPMVMEKWRLVPPLLGLPELSDLSGQLREPNYQEFPNSWGKGVLMQAQPARLMLQPSWGHRLSSAGEFHPHALTDPQGEPVGFHCYQRTRAPSNDEQFLAYVNSLLVR